MRASSSPAVSLVKGGAWRVGHGKGEGAVSARWCVHIGQCGCNFKNTASELGEERSRFSAWAGWEGSGKSKGG